MSIPQNNLDDLRRKLPTVMQVSNVPNSDIVQANKNFRFKSSVGTTRSLSTPSTSVQPKDTAPQVPAQGSTSTTLTGSMNMVFDPVSLVRRPPPVRVKDSLRTSASLSSAIPAKRSSSPDEIAAVKRAKTTVTQSQPTMREASLRHHVGIPSQSSSRTSSPQEVQETDLIHYQKFSSEKLHKVLTSNVARQLALLDECVNVAEINEALPDEAMLREFIGIIRRRNAAIQKAMELTRGNASTPSSCQQEIITFNAESSQKDQTIEIFDRMSESLSATNGPSSLIVVENSSDSAQISGELKEPTGMNTFIGFDDDNELWAQVDDVTTDSYAIASNHVSPTSRHLQPISNTLGCQNRQNTDFTTEIEPPAALMNASYYDEAIQVLHKTFKLDSFRPNQFEAIGATLAGQDVFVLMPTGGGKSLCYQVPAVCITGVTRGVTVVVCPLIALMQDQVDNLLKRGVDAVLLNSDQGEEDSREAQGRFSSKGAKPKLVYVTPEKLHRSGNMRSILARLYREKQLARFVIDEAHCVSTWGRDFRDSYKDLSRLREEFPNVPIMALTATANEQVMTDVIDRLGIKGCKLFKQSFNRANLFYDVRPKRRHMLEDISSFIKGKHKGQTGIVYCLGRKTCENVATALRNDHGIRARHYHAGLTPDEKTRAQAAWQSGECEIIVATIAFGMGIDKPDVRYVIHHTMPKSLDGYYQETGRAGRDGKPATCVLFYNYNDTKPLFKMIQEGDKSPEERKRQEDDVRAVVQYCQNVNDCRRAQVLSYFGQSFDRKDCKRNCNNCSDTAEYVEEDMTQIAIKAIQLVKSLVDRDQHVTKLHCLDVFRGANIKAIRDKGHDRLQLYGAGSDLSREQVERLFDHLLNLEAFRQVTVANKSGWHSLYMQLGPTVNDFLKGNRNLVLKSKVLQESENTLSRAPTKRVKRKAAAVASVNKSVAGDPFSDDDLQNSKTVVDVDDIYDFGSPPPEVQHTTNLQRPPRKGSCDAGERHQKCYQDLLKLRSEATEGENDFFDDDTLQYISVMLPQDSASLQEVLCDNYPNDNTERLRESYGTKILQICSKHRMSTSALDAQKPASKTKFDSTELHAQYDFQNTKPSSRGASKANRRPTLTGKSGIRAMPLY